jgi:hypothetical protein
MMKIDVTTKVNQSHGHQHLNTSNFLSADNRRDYSRMGLAVSKHGQRNELEDRDLASYCLSSRGVVRIPYRSYNWSLNLSVAGDIVDPKIVA